MYIRVTVVGKEVENSTLVRFEFITLWFTPQYMSVGNWACSSAPKNIMALINRSVHYFISCFTSKSVRLKTVSFRLHCVWGFIKTSPPLQTNCSSTLFILYGTFSHKNIVRLKSRNYFFHIASTHFQLETNIVLTRLIHCSHYMFCTVIHGNF